MRESIKIIKYTGLISAIFLVLTYVVSVNMDNSFVKLNTPWISNNFMLTVTGGVFASVLVVLLCEVRKYCYIKASTEDQMFWQGFYLFEALQQEKQNIDNYLSHPDICIPPNLVDETTRTIQCQINVLRTIEYVTFMHTLDTLMVEHGKFVSESTLQFLPVLQGPRKLESAILETKIAATEKEIEMLKARMARSEANGWCAAPTVPITSSAERVNKALTDLSAALEADIEFTDKYLQKVDQYCRNRFALSEKKAGIIIPHLLDV